MIHTCNLIICPRNKTKFLFRLDFTTLQVFLFLELQSEPKKWRNLQQAVRTFLAGRGRGMQSIVPEEWVSWLKIPPVLDPGMWTMHPCVTFELGTPSNQLLLGENLDTRLFLENIRILYPWCPRPHNLTLISLADMRINIWTIKFNYHRPGDPIKWASCESRQGRQVGPRVGAKDPKTSQGSSCPLDDPWPHVIPCLDKGQSSAN